MKKTLIMILSLSLACLVLLAGCKVNPANNTTTNPNNTTNPTSPTTTEPLTTQPTTTTTETTTTTSPSAGGNSGAAGVLAEIKDKADYEFGMTFEEAVTAETSQSYLGLTAEEFEQYVVDASASSAAITSIARLTAVIECNSAEDAETVKGLVAQGFDTGRWICVFPQESFVVNFGEYVLLSADSAEGAEAIRAAVADYAGDTLGEIEVIDGIK